MEAKPTTCAQRSNLRILFLTKTALEGVLKILLCFLKPYLKISLGYLLSKKSCFQRWEKGIGSLEKSRDILVLYELVLVTLKLADQILGNIFKQK